MWYKCNNCGQIFEISEQAIKQYKAQIDYGNMLQSVGFMGLIQDFGSLLSPEPYDCQSGIDTVMAGGMLASRGNFINNMANDPMVCSKCGSKSIHLMSQYEIDRYNNNLAKKNHEKEELINESINFLGKAEALHNIYVQAIKKCEEIKLKKIEKRKRAFETPINSNIDINSLIKRILQFLEDCEWDMAEHYIEYALDMEPDFYYLYFLKLLALSKCRNAEIFMNSKIRFDNNCNLVLKILKYADSKFIKEIENHNSLINKNFVNAMEQEKDMTLDDLKIYGEEPKNDYSLSTDALFCDFDEENESKPFMCNYYVNKDSVETFRGIKINDNIEDVFLKYGKRKMIQLCDFGMLQLINEKFKNAIKQTIGAIAYEYKKSNGNSLSISFFIDENKYVKVIGYFCIDVAYKDMIDFEKRANILNNKLKNWK